MDGLGQCIGPNICCGPAIGCYVNTVETEVCRHENENPTPCSIEAELCGNLPSDGYCMADGICCTDGEHSQFMFIFFHYFIRNCVCVVLQVSFLCVC